MEHNKLPWTLRGSSIFIVMESNLCLIQIFDGQNFYLIDPLSADELASEKNAKNLGKPFANSSTRNNVTENGLRLLLESPR